MKLTKQQITVRLAEIKSQQDMLSRICKATNASQTADAITAEVERLNKEGQQLQIDLAESIPYKVEIKGYIKYDHAQSWQNFQQENISAEEALHRNKILADNNLTARWIPFFEVI